MSNKKERNYVIQNYKSQTNKLFFLLNKILFFFPKHQVLRELKIREKKSGKFRCFSKYYTVDLTLQVTSKFQWY